MTRRSKIKAWDRVYDETSCIHLLGKQHDTPEDAQRERFVEQLGELAENGENLRIEQIHQIGDLMHRAFLVGKGELDRG